MRDLFVKFRKEESGTSLVEYAVALIVVTIVGGAGVLLLGQNSKALAEAGCETVGNAASVTSANADAGVAVTGISTTC